MIFSPNFAKPLQLGDLTGGLTAAVVALPLALAFGVASGLGPAAGLWGAIAVGAMAAVFGGTATQISGPTGPMTVVMTAVLMQFSLADPVNGPAMAFACVVLAGGFQIGFSMLKLGRYFVMVPVPVVSGFMSGIGCIIVLLQLAPLLGNPIEANVLDATLHLPDLFNQFHANALLIGAGALGLVAFWPRTWSRFCPGPLAALVLLTPISLGFGDTVERIGSIPSGLPHLTWPALSVTHLPDLLAGAVLLAALGSIDSLLTSMAADNVTRQQHHSDQELRGQGLGNILAGLIGGLPGAGATVRTLVNINSGGRTGLSGLIHAAALMGLVLGMAPLAEPIPNAVLAGILIHVGLCIIDWRFLARLHRMPLESGVLMVVVTLITVFVDLITAVAIGMFVANLMTIRRLSESQMAQQSLGNDPSQLAQLTEPEAALLHQADNQILLYRLKGDMTYALCRDVAGELSRFTDYQVMVLDLTEVQQMDLSIELTLEDMIQDTLANDRYVLVTGAALSWR